MATDVFGRPLNDVPTTTPVNRHPLAPNPLAPGPQTEPFSGIRGPGDLGTERASSSEFLGAVYGIQASRPTGISDGPAAPWPGSPGGRPLPSAVPHNPMPDFGHRTPGWAEE